MGMKQFDAIGDWPGKPPGTVAKAAAKLRLGQPGGLGTFIQRDEQKSVQDHCRGVANRYPIADRHKNAIDRLEANHVPRRYAKRKANVRPSDMCAVSPVCLSS